LFIIAYEIDYFNIPSLLSYFFWKNIGHKTAGSLRRIISSKPAITTQILLLKLLLIPVLWLEPQWSQR